MNAVTLSGIVAADSEARTVTSGRTLIGFDVVVSGPPKSDPIVHCAYFPNDGEDLELHAGDFVMVVGRLRHRRDVGDLFVAANEVFLLQCEPEGRHASR